MLLDPKNLAAEIADELEQRRAHNSLKLLRSHQVVELTGLSRAMVYALENKGEFPRRVPLTKQISAWIEGEVIQWIEQKVAARDTTESERRINSPSD